MNELGIKILALRTEGKTYNQIRDELNCSKGTIAYYCGDGQKEKVLPEGWSLDSSGTAEYMN